MEVVEINCETGVETLRPMTPEELAVRASDAQEHEASVLEAETKEARKREAKEAIGSWLLGRADMTPEVRAAIMGALAPEGP